MTGQAGAPRQFDLEDRTLEFARRIRTFVKLLPRTVGNVEDVRQLIRSSGSVGANYIEANGALGKRDFAMKIKVCRKETKESRYWLNLLDTQRRQQAEGERRKMVQEATELMSIFGAILKKTQ